MRVLPSVKRSHAAEYARGPDLVTRVLYRIRTAAEQQAVDAVTYGIFAALVTRIIAEKGIGVKADDTEASMEQVALAVDVLAFAGPAGAWQRPADSALYAESGVGTCAQRHPSTTFVLA